MGNLFLAGLFLCFIGSHPVTAHTHRCIHDKVRRTVNKTRTPATQEYKHHGRHLESATWSGIRIKPFYHSLTADSQMSQAKADYITQQLMPAALARWGELLKVLPVDGNLFLHRDCNSYWPSSSKCASYSTPFCGWGEGDGAAVPADQLGVDLQYASAGANPTSLPGGVGIASADMAVYVFAASTSVCTGGVLAYASACQRDQFDRPVLAVINVCPNQIDTTKLDFALGVVLHELGHTLGFSSDSFSLFRQMDANRTPRTPRDPYLPGRVSSANVKTYNCGGYSNSVDMATNTVTFVSERGMSCTVSGSLTPMSNCVHKIASPRSLELSKWFFGCDTMNGIELDNHDTGGGCAIMSSHLETRVFGLTTMMVPYASDFTQLITAALLAVYEDSGWYQPDYTKADGAIKGRDWGFKQGCSFAKDKCITNGVSTGSPAHFFTSTNWRKCTLDRKALGYSQVTYNFPKLSSQYRYFGTAYQGGPSDTYDWCPAANSYSDGPCNVAANAPALLSGGEGYGADSLCIDSTLLWSGYSATYKGGACYTTSCVAKDQLRIFVGPNSAGSATTTINCVGAASAGTTKTVNGYTGVITCPDPTTLCGDPVNWSPAATPSITPSAPATPSNTPSRPATPSRSTSAAVTPSSTKTLSATKTAVPTASASPSPTRSKTQSPSQTPSPSATPSRSATRSQTATKSRTPSQTGSKSPPPSPTKQSPAGTRAATPTKTRSPTSSPSKAVPSKTPTRSVSRSPSASAHSASPTRSKTHSATKTRSATRTPTRTPTRTHV